MKFKKDKYSRARGGKSVCLRIRCNGCGDMIGLYQKDGDGALYRMYWDRLYSFGLIKGNKLITCLCGKLIGYDYTYKRENRPAIKLFAGSVSKKKVKI
jgi:hypothetical protein